MKGDERADSSLLLCINEKSSSIVDCGDYINELFLYFIVPVVEKHHKLGATRREELALMREGSKLSRSLRDELVNESVFFVAKHGLKSVISLVRSIAVCLFSVVILPVYVLLKFRSASSLPAFDDISVIRSPASYSKMMFLKKDNVSFIFDSLVYKVESESLSLYSASLFGRLCGALLIPWMGVRDLIELFFLSRRHLGFSGAVKILRYYEKRIAHKVVFEFYLNRLLANIKPKCLYTGNKEDRYALVEKRMCKSLNIKTVCVPHGLEYSFKMPGGLVGDVFYCNSQYARDYLAKLYRCDAKFVFDRQVVENMLSRNVSIASGKKVVFFPESREPEKNLAIIKFLREKGIDFSVKLHGRDSLDNYLPFVDQSMLVESFDVAISNSICLARKSTVLIEALYNNSIPLAVLVDDKDRKYFDFMFPSLNDEGIHKIYSFVELGNFIKQVRDDNVSK